LLVSYTASSLQAPQSVFERAGHLHLTAL
jgi:hypothetical protein